MIKAECDEAFSIQLLEKLVLTKRTKGIFHSYSSRGAEEAKLSISKRQRKDLFEIYIY